jgi:hypothetical protein
MAFRILNTVFWTSVLCLKSDRCELALFVVLNVQIGPGFIFEPCG